LDPSSTQRFRRITAWLAVAWALGAAVLSLGSQVALRPAVVPPVSYSVLAGVMTVQWASPAAEAAGVVPGHRITSIDGTPAIRFSWRNTLEAGVANRWVFNRHDGSDLHVDLVPLDGSGAPNVVEVPLYLATLFAGGVYLLVGLFVWRLRPDRDESWAFLLLCCFLAAMLFSSTESDLQPAAYERIMLNLGLIGASSFHFFTLFPVEPPIIVRHRRIRLLPWIAAAAIGLLALVEVPLGVAPGVVGAFAFFFSIGAALLGLAMLATQRLRLRDEATAQRADVVLLGFAVGFVPVIAVLLAQILFRASYPVYPVLLWFVVFPLIVAYGVLRKELFDIRLAARSSVVYGLVTLGVTGLFAATVAFTDIVGWRWGVDTRSPLVSSVFVFFAILLFNPIRNRLQSLVDRTFDRDRARYRHAVREISDAMVSMLSIKEVVDRILVALTDTMGVERAFVLLLDDDQRALTLAASRGDWDEENLEMRIPGDHPIVKQLWMRRDELARSDFADEPDPEVRDACQEIFDTLEVGILVPVLFGVDLIGVIAVGRKVSGERLSHDDRQLLRTLANQSSIAIENAKAFDEIAQLNETLEARVEERTEELQRTQAQLVQNEKMVSLGQLVAGVAHELNNPIGFVHANLQLIEGYAEKLIKLAPVDDPKLARMREALEKLFSRSREGTDRVKQIVADLRTFSRLDQAEVQRVDLNEAIDSTLSLMEPRLKQGIQVEREYGELPEVRCYAGQLNQVFMNLLMNACDSLDSGAGGGSIRVRTSVTPNGVRLEFGDDGPGIPPEIQNRLFEPFFTTKDVGKGTGLGLSLSHGIVERHGGSIRVDSQPGSGATFVIDLPFDAAPEEPS
jgi:signal transduction histidine kinase